MPIDHDGDVGGVSGGDVRDVGGVDMSRLKNLSGDSYREDTGHSLEQCVLMGMKTEQLKTRLVHSGPIYYFYVDARTRSWKILSC